MHLKLFRHLWGLDTPWDLAFPEIKARGYAGVEALLPSAADESRFIDLLKQHDLELIVTAYTRGSSVDEHLRNLRLQAERARRLGARFVGAQAGSDAFGSADSNRFYSEALKIEADLGIVIAYETHRSRPLFHPRSTLQIVEKFPALKIVCDFSHWVCVCERMIDDFMPIVRRVADQAYHIHARVGYAEGPQVPDPRAERYRTEVEAHERWWDVLWDSQVRRGFEQSTMCPEFGPPPYLQTHPQTGEPLANLKEVVDWQRERQQKRFALRTNR